ncbi:MAG TPA: hypothetical protein PKL73_18135 [Polyangiaceae bacterium]|jgi:hypothetical protein|nr:hypothetical protein [Polyangiaceae bacterium]HNZ24386.1 hypothetical protein [Polyangiaceae bacterium]HOD22592.1 hypothetical protein [Polyangiaceae bacterium]HOE51047.1 hypothetical protein [Polyangiaceae bacterium]HOH02416.1 hypothetical protein [Polyangiaceae bacterium]
MMTDTRILWDFDVRVRDRNLKTGRLKKDEVDRYYDNLVDVTNNVDAMEARQPTLPTAEDKHEEEPSAVQGSPSMGYAPAAPGLPMMQPIIPHAKNEDDY